MIRKQDYDSSMKIRVCDCMLLLLRAALFLAWKEIHVTEAAILSAQSCQSCCSAGSPNLILTYCCIIGINRMSQREKRLF